jgi:hypothetical protein
MTILRILCLSSSIVVAASQAARAERSVYLLLAIDKADRQLGAGAKYDEENLKSLFKSQIPTRALQEPIPVEMTPQGILSAIERVPADFDDVIVFMYCGHGGYGDDGEHMFYLQNDRNRSVSRASVVAALREKRHGLIVLLSNACFNYVQPPRDGGPRAGDAPTPRRAYNAVSPLFMNLFFKYNGFVDITACKRNEVAVSHRDPRDGTFFFDAFIDACAEKKQDPDANWESIVGLMTAKVRSFWQVENVEAQQNQIRNNGFVDQISQTVTINSLSFTTLLPAAVEGLPPNFPPAPPPPFQPPAPPPPPAPPAPNNGPRFGIATETRTQGVMVTAVQEGSPASSFGQDGIWTLEPGDVISHINGVHVRTHEQFVEQLRKSPQVMRFRVVAGQDGRSYDFSVRLNY